jgi:hypothetical protein
VTKSECAYLKSKLQMRRLLQAGGGFLHIVSAKYGRPNDRQYEVKEEIKKRLPKGPITDPVEITCQRCTLAIESSLYDTNRGSSRQRRNYAEGYSLYFDDHLRI